MEIEAKIQGINELERMLNEIGSPKVEKKIVTKALREGAKIILKEWQDTIAVRTGKLKKSLAVISVRSRGSEKKVMKVGARATPRWGGYHGHLVEFGVPSRGIPARPALRTAVRSKFDEFLDTYIKGLDKGITQIVKKHAR